MGNIKPHFIPSPSPLFTVHHMWDSVYCDRAQPYQENSKPHCNNFEEKLAGFQEGPREPCEIRELINITSRHTFKPLTSLSLVWFSQLTVQKSTIYLGANQSTFISIWMLFQTDKEINTAHTFLNNHCHIIVSTHLFAGLSMLSIHSG